MKGLEIPGYEPRALQTMALGFAVGTRGADHNRSGAYEVDFSDAVDRRRVTVAAVHHAIDTEDRAALMDSLILCKFLRGVFDDFYGRGRGDAEPGHGLGHRRRRAAPGPPSGSCTPNGNSTGSPAGTPAEDTLPERFLQGALPNDPAAALSRERLEAVVAE